MNILDQLAEHARERVEIAKRNISALDIRKTAEDMPRRIRNLQLLLEKRGCHLSVNVKRHLHLKGL